MSDPFRVAVAGLGFGAAVHVPGFRSLAGVDIVAIAGKSVENAERVAYAIGIPTGVGGYEKLIESNPDAVSIALPPKQNATAAEFFLKRGIPVLCEKPIAGDVAAALRLDLLARHIPHAVDFQFAELPAFRAARSAIQGGRIGRVRHIQITWLVESYANRHKIHSWKRQPEEAGGVLSLFGSHVFYLLGWLDSPISTVSGRLSTEGITWTSSAGSSPDTCQCWAELVSGTTASLMISNASPGMNIHRWEILGDTGTLILENRSKDYMAKFTFTVMDRDGEHSLTVDEPSGNEDGRISAFATLANRFITSVKDNTQTYPTFSDGRRVQCEIEAVLKSNSIWQTVAPSKF